MENIKVGADPEFFLYSKKHDEYVSAWGLFPGTKKDPYPLEGGAMQVDGTALEFNIDACTDSKAFNYTIVKVLDQIKDIICKVDSDLGMDFTPLIQYTPERWKDISYRAKVLGCEVDYDLMGKANRKVNPKRYRTAAGHVHLGFTKGKVELETKHFNNCCKIAKYFYTHKSLELYPLTELEKQRLKFYGDFGSFRPKSYGIELRSPSNMWVSRESTRLQMFNRVQDTYRKVVNDA